MKNTQVYTGMLKFVIVGEPYFVVQVINHVVTDNYSFSGFKQVLSFLG